MSTTPRGAPELASAQALPEATVNEQIRRTEAGASYFPVADRVTAPPGTCSDGAVYLIIATATGAFTGKEGQLATAVGANAASGWYYRVLGTKDEGVMAYVQDEDTEYRWSGSAWGSVPGGSTPTETIILACSDETTAITTGTAKVTFRMPYAFTLTAVRASVTTAPTGSTIIIDINEGGSTILSTKLSIDATEKTSTTAASAAVISDTALADDAEMTIDFDQVGSTIAGAGVKVYLIGHQ